MISHSDLLKILQYDPETGHFFWKISHPKGRVEAGQKAGTIGSHGYVIITIDARKYRAHRLAWFYITGEWPTCFIDHKDTNRTNNSWSNLRLATQSQNIANSRIAKNNASGRKGVYWHGASGKWSASIMYQGKPQYLGLFSSIDEAATAYRKAAERLFGSFARY